MCSSLTSPLVCVVEFHLKLSRVSAHSKRCLNNHSTEDIHLNQTMKIIQLQICEFIASHLINLESLTNKQVSLGADVNISCDLDIKEIYWYKRKLPDPPVLMLHTFDSTYERAEYENSIFENKYSVKTNSRLLIRNISTDELGVYYCVKTSEPLKFSNSTKIYISDSVQRNQTAEFEPHDASQDHKSWRNLIIIIISSALLNVLWIITLIGLFPFIIPLCSTSPNLKIESRPCQDQTTYSLLQPIKT
ncbi:T cell receptor gamma variable 4 [Labeo rohita]|nr:T cell receptor gamma variable 4 [Labeo rohita]